MPGKNLSFLVMMLAAAGPALAAHPLITDDTGTQGKGRFQLELNGEVSRDRETLGGIKTREDAGEAAAVFSAGVTDNVDVVISLPWVWSRLKEDGALVADEAGPGDAGLEVKWRFLARGRFSLALKPGITLPTGDEEKGLGNGKASYSLALIVAWEWERFFIYVNGAYTRNEFQLDIDKETNRRDIWHPCIAAGAEVAKGLTVVGNFGMEQSEEKASDTWPAFLIAGIIYSVTENFDIDLGVKRGLNKPEPDLSGMAGIAWRY